MRVWRGRGRRVPFFFQKFSTFFSFRGRDEEPKKTHNFRLSFCFLPLYPLQNRLVKKGDRLLLMPNRSPVTVAAIHRDDVEVSAARGGENLRLRLSGVDEDEVQAGFVLCSRR